jgi:hypothetical protein
LRFMFDHFQSDLLFNLLLGTKPMRLAAGMVYFHHKGVFEPQGAEHRIEEPPDARRAE